MFRFRYLESREYKDFLPSKHPKYSKKVIKYMTHEKISGLESIVKSEDTNFENQSSNK